MGSLPGGGTRRFPLNPDNARRFFSGDVVSASRPWLFARLEEGAAFDFEEGPVLIADVDILKSWA
jgi:hypothetical protein